MERGWPYVTRPRQARKTIEIDATIKSTSNEKIDRIYIALNFPMIFKVCAYLKRNLGVVCRNERDI